MKRHILIGVVVLLATSSLLSAQQPAYKPGSVLVRFADVNTKPPTTTVKNNVLNSIFKSSGSRIEREYTLVGGLTLANLPAGISVENAVASLKQSSSILYAEPDYRIDMLAVPNDTMFGQMWGLNNTGQSGGAPDADIDAVEAWDIATGSNAIIVAVSDTGVDYNHPDLAANMWHNPGEIPGNGIDDDDNGYIDDVYGCDNGDNDGDPMDDSPGGGHGTHVAGTIGAVGNNARGVAGVCWNVRIMALKISDSNGGPGTWGAWVSNAIAGIQYSVSKGARVINASWRAYEYSQPLYDAIADARDAGVIFVAAAGNEIINNDLTPPYPVSYDLSNIIAVMATDDTDQMSYYSNYGLTSVDLGAPGGAQSFANDPRGILSTWPGNQYRFIQGTSMASPHVTGACALILSIDPTLTYSQVKKILIDTVDPTLPGLCVSGGRLNLAAAAQEAATDTTPPALAAGWEIEPQATGLHTIAMEAKKLTDRSGVEYYFECVNDTNINSGWISSTLYKFSDSTFFHEGTAYNFRCKARDKSPQHNQTEWSAELSATTASGIDNLPPAPNPARWDIKPKIQRTGISMKAKGKGTDENGELFLFAGSFNSGAQSSDTFTIPSSSLTIGTTYHFQVAVMDSHSNRTDWSEDVTVTWATSSRILPVPSQYGTIQAAINAANDGDTVVVSPWPYFPYTYRGYGPNNYYGNLNIHFLGKKITVRSVNPEDPNIVAATIIDCQGSEIPVDPCFPRRAFIFDGGEGSDSVLAGFTIRNGFVKGLAGQDGGIIDANDANGQNGGQAIGGSIFCGDANFLGIVPSSPTIRNCVIESSVAEGGNGGNGVDGNDGTDYQAPDVNGEGGQEATPGQTGGRGGNSGPAFGGAIYCGPGSSPVIQNCIIRSCSVRTGIPGNGGNGGNGGNDPNLGPAPGGDAGNGGSVLPLAGGGIFTDPFAAPPLIGCTITDCNALSFVDAGLPGQPGTGNPPGLPGLGGGYSEAYGGGVFYNAGSDAINISSTTFSQNQVHQRILIQLSTGELFYATGGGIIFYGSDSDITMTDCVINGNDANGDGGGIARLFGNSNLILRNCDATANSSIHDGGGLFNSSGAVQVYDSGFTDNDSNYGGGIYLDTTSLTLANGKLFDNTAKQGGAIYGFDCSISIDSSEIIGNSAISLSAFADGLGGGLAFWNTDGIIRDCVMQSNSAADTGGAVFLAGWDSNPVQLTNCLIISNSAGYAGGGVAAHVSGWASLDNCTVADNYTNDWRGTGGGISCEEGMALVELNNSIVWGNSANYGGPQIAVGSFYPTYSDPTADVYVNYTDVEGGEGQVFINNTDFQAVWWQQGNIDADPLFATTDISKPTYYLSQIPAGQLVNSPCINIGNNTAENLGLGTLTTRTDQIPDSDIVDLGYHYRPDETFGKYQLTIQVYIFDPVFGGYGRLNAKADGDNPFDISDPCTIAVNQGTFVDLTAIPVGGFRVQSWRGTDNDASTALNNSVIMDSDKTVVVTFEPNGLYFLTVTVIGNGTVEPNGRTLRTPGEVVTLTATPNNPSDVILWNGTDDDFSHLITNTVTMNGHKNVTVRFYSPRILYVGADGDFETIQRAIEESSDGDIVMVQPGTYNIYESSEDLTRLTIINRAITITSVDPTHPEDTVILGGFALLDVGRDTVLDGFTIQAGYGNPDGCPGQNTQCGNPLDDGSNGYPTAGAGLRLHNYYGSVNRGDGGNSVQPQSGSPTVRNCIFLNCTVFAGSGAGGAAGGDGGWGGWAHGGAVSVGPDSNPLFENCTFTGSRAYPGDGGNGGSQPAGHGGSWSWSGIFWDWEPDGGYKDYWRYSGYGGAIYCDTNSSPEFVDCNFTDNIAFGSSSGISGTPTVGGWPYSHYQINRFGGAVYCSGVSSPIFNNCTFNENRADISGLRWHWNRTDSADTAIAYSNLSHGGAVAFEEAASPRFINCSFNNNIAHVGGGSWSDDAFPYFADSSFTGNVANYGAGMLIINDQAEILRTEFTGNDANNAGSQGGAIASLGSNAVIADCNINGNNSLGYGAGIYISSKDIDGADISGDNTVLVKNCLITDNTATLGGAGITTAWHCDPNIVNCTIAENVAGQGMGGGLYSAYGNFTNVINSIFWNNTAPSGPQIAVTNNGNPAYVKVIYSDVEGGAALVRVDPGATLEWDVPTGNPAYPTNIHLDPLFVSGPEGDFYLSQTPAGQAQTSPCVNAGSDLAETLGFTLYTTRTDEVPDRTIVDMGYHSRILEPCRFSDLMKDGTINFDDFAILALSWLDEGCGEPNSWCGGADLTNDTYVNMDDLTLVTGCWLARDTFPPMPNPSQWAIEPFAASSTSVSMQAVQSIDLLWGFPVQYYFDCDSGDCNDSGWQTEPTYIDVNLAPDTEYSYKVKARDTVGNETEFSVIRFVTTTIGPGSDTTPPTPNPMTWAIEPRAATTTSVEMRATTATDNSGLPVQYQFEETTGNLGGTDSGWQSDPCYVDTGLDPNNQYCYRVSARDQFNNITGWSAVICASNLGDPNPPTPAPTIVISDTNFVLQDTYDTSAQFSIAGGAYWHKIVVNVSGITDDVTPTGNIEIRFVCSNGSFSSTSVVPNPITLGVASGTVWGSIAQGYRVTFLGATIVYDVDVDTFAALGRTLDWTVCAYDAADNPACSVTHTLGPPLGF